MYELITVTERGYLFVDLEDRLDVLQDYYEMRLNARDTMSLMLIEIDPRTCEGKVLRTARP